MEPVHGLVVDSQETLSRPLLGNLQRTTVLAIINNCLFGLLYLVLQVPDSVLVYELLVHHAALGQYAHLEAAHVEEQVGVVLAVHRHKAVLPLYRGDGARQTVLDLPEYGTPTEIHKVIKV